MCTLLRIILTAIFLIFAGSMTKKGILSLVGFLLFIAGFTALSLSMVGLRWSWLAWLDDISPLLGFLTKLGMSVLGIALVAYVRMDNSLETSEIPLKDDPH